MRLSDGLVPALSTQIPQLKMSSPLVGKRKCPESHSPESVQDIREWLESIINSGGMGNVSGEQKTFILDAVIGNEIDKEVLKSLTEEDLEKVMGVKVFGQRRKLKERIKELFVDSNAAPGTSNVHSKGCDISPQQPSGERQLDHRNCIRQ